jgi:hypothetical protein
MKIDFFTTLGFSAFLFYLIFYTVGYFTSNDATLLLLVALFSLALIIFSLTKFPDQNVFKIGAATGVVALTTLLLIGKIVRTDFEKFLIYFGMYLIAFFVAGYASKGIRKLMSKLKK